MIFVIQTNDEVAGLDITTALSSAGISHTIISKNYDAAKQRVQRMDESPRVFRTVNQIFKFFGIGSGSTHIR